ncbi:MAG: CoxG family protein [Anaerolineales bacterium]
MVVATIGFGSVVVVFKTDVEFQVMKEIEFARVKAHGRSADSVVDATSEIFLSNGIDGTTDLRWTAEIAVFGKISSVASRMMGSVTRKLATEFFDCVKKQIEA